MRSERGFTLLEMMIATVVMAVAIAGVLAALSTSVRNGARLTERDRAAMLARRKLDELLVERKLVRHVILEGAYDASSGWKARVTPFEIPENPGPGTKILERIEVQIWSTASGTPRTFHAEGFRRSMLTQEDINSGVLLPR